MRAHEFVNIEEARMGSSDFAAAVEQGQARGVLVGYEFEVCVPEATFKPTTDNAAAAVVGDAIDANLVQTGIALNRLLQDSETRDFSAQQFDQVFRLRPNVNSTYATAVEAETAWHAKLLEQVIAAFNRIPAVIRARYKDRAMSRLRQERNLTNFQKQMRFARYLGSEIYDNHRDPLASLGLDLQGLASKSDNWSEIIETWLGVSGDVVESRFNQYFDYDPARAYDVLDLGDYEEYDDEDYDEYLEDEYNLAAQVLKPALEATYNRPVHVFNRYHEHAKNLTDWYIEPDSSLRPAGNDGSAEIVSPPMPAQQAMSALQSFYSMAQQLNLYTNSSTGLHINVSIPQNLDILKLAVFVGDRYVLQQFGRSDSSYAQSVGKTIGRKAAKLPAAKNKKLPYNVKALQKLAKNATDFHSASISDNGKYISFRHAGGDYLADLNKVAATVSRFIRAMLIAADPTAYVQEYQAALAKLTQAPVQTNLPTQIRTQGLPVFQISMYVTSKNKSIEQFRPVEISRKDFYIKNIEPNSAAAKQLIVDTLRSPEKKQYAQNDSVDKFYTLIAVPRNETGLQDINSFQEHGVNSEKIGYSLIRKSTIPANDPAAQALLKSVLQSQYSKKPVTRTR